MLNNCPIDGKVTRVETGPLTATICGWPWILPTSQLVEAVVPRVIQDVEQYESVLLESAPKFSGRGTTVPGLHLSTSEMHNGTESLFRRKR